MESMTVWLLLFTIVGCFIKDATSVQVEVMDRERLVLPGDNVTFTCRVATHIQYCRAEIPGLNAVNLSPKIKTSQVNYVGKGLPNGDCGFTINRVEERNNGEVRCSIGLEDELNEAIGTMKLIVAKRPKDPEMDLSRGTDKLSVYKINDVLQASCIVRDGRPVANISWFLDEEPIPGSELSMPTIIDLAKENLQTQIQNLSRVLQASDNGKSLRCVAYHLAYPGGMSQTFRQLDVKYPPLPQENPIDRFGYQIGQIGLISVDVEANPKPQIEWNIDGQKIREGSNDNTGRIEAETANELGKGRYKINLRIANINKQDTEKEYTLTAYNDMGSENYRVKISTSPEPEGLELGLGSIIGIVVAVCLVVVIVVVIIFARVTGKWCFSGRRERHIGESSDTESTDVQRPKETRRHLSPIKLTSYFKKNKDKVASEEEPETRQIDTTDTSKPADEQTEVDDQAAKEGLVYAELDLVSPNANPVLKNDDDKTEYAEIVYTPPKDGDKTTKK